MALDFIYFHLSHIRPTPWRPSFSTNPHFFFENRPNTFGGEDFLNCHYLSHIRQNNPALWRAKNILVAMETRIVHGSKTFEGI